MAKVISLYAEIINIPNSCAAALSVQISHLFFVPEFVFQMEKGCCSPINQLALDTILKVNDFRVLLGYDKQGVCLRIIINDGITCDIRYR